MYLTIADRNSSPLIVASVMTGTVCLMAVSYVAWSKTTGARARGYLPLALTQAKID